MKRISSFFKQLIYSEGVNALSTKVIMPIFFLELFSAMTNYMPFSFMPKLVKMFGYSEVNIGSRVGLLGASLYLGNIFSSFIWGIMADTFGRKRTMLIAGVLTTLTWLSFGFSFTYWWAFITRFLLGLSGGSDISLTKEKRRVNKEKKLVEESEKIGQNRRKEIGRRTFYSYNHHSLFIKLISRASGETVTFSFFIGTGLSVILTAILVAETDDTNRNLGMSIMYGTYSLGHILGPSTGGFLAFPHLRYPDVFKEDSIFTEFPILLPTVIVSFCMGLMLVVVYRFVPADKKKEIQVDYREMRDKLTEAKLTEKSLLLPAQSNIPSYEIKITHFENQYNGKTKKGISSFEMIKKIARNKVCVMSCILYGMLSFVYISYSEILPVYAATITSYGGFGFSPADIGLLLMLTAVTTIIFQFTVSSKILDLFGLKKSFIISNLIKVFLFPLIPLCQKLQSNRYGFWAALIACTSIMQISDSTSYISANLLVSTSVEKSLLASANGLCMTAGIFGRLIGVPIAGVVYSWSLTNERNSSVKKEVLVFPFNHYFIFFILSICTVLNITLAYFLPDNLDRKTTVAKNRMSRQSQLLDVDL